MQTISHECLENKPEPRLRLQQLRALPGIETGHTSRTGLGHSRTRDAVTLCDQYGEPVSVLFDRSTGAIDVHSGWQGAYWKSSADNQRDLDARVAIMVGEAVALSEHHARARRTGDHSGCCDLRVHPRFKGANVSPVALAVVNASARAVGCGLVQHAGDLLRADDAFRGAHFDDGALNAFSRLVNNAACGDSDRLLAHLALYYGVLGQDARVDRASRERAEGFGCDVIAKHAR